MKRDQIANLQSFSVIFASFSNFVNSFSRIFVFFFLVGGERKINQKKAREFVTDIHRDTVDNCL